MRTGVRTTLFFEPIGVLMIDRDGHQSSDLRAPTVAADDRPALRRYPPAAVASMPAPDQRSSRRAQWKERLSARERRVVRDVGIRVAAARKRRGLTRRQAALLSGIDAAHFGVLERGEDNIKMLTLLKIADALGVALIDLVPQRASEALAPAPA